jgi:hypothetical protein
MIRPCVLLSILLVAAAMPIAVRSSQDPLAPVSQPPQTSQTPVANAAQPKPKKVWTNDNLGDASGTISVVGDPNKPSKPQPKPAANAPADKSVSPQVLAKLRDELHKLQVQLTVVDQQLSDLKGLSKGESKSSAAMRPSLNYDSSSVEEQIRRLQDKKTKIQSTIDDLYDAARAAGIEPGQLR